MKAIAWLAVLAFFGGVGYSILRWRRQWAERQRAADERLASFIGQAKPERPPGGIAPPQAVAAPLPQPVAPPERLLFDAADKAGEAGEPVLAIQLYARLLARYPETRFADLARAAVAEQKKKLAKA